MSHQSAPTRSPEFPRFAEALAFYDWITPEALRRRDTIGLVNLDRVDLGCQDGLTEAEREQL